ncbi:MAG: serine hydrolase [Fimbriimonadaceae bacterium]
MLLAVAALAVAKMGNAMIDPAVDLNLICEQAFKDAQAKYPEDMLKPEDVSISIYVIKRASNSWIRGGYRGDQSTYPASVVKMFYMAYAAHLMDKGELVSSPEFERAANDMIKDSNNDATGYIVDRVCGTTPGPELSEKDLKIFGDKRRAVNRWFEALGYKGINAVQRTYNEGPYGRERQWVGEKFDNRNSLSAEVCGQLLADIALEKHWGAKSAAWMKDLLHRANNQDEPDKADGQSRAYIGRVIPSGTKLYSKAGWTSETRHDAAWLVMPDGREFAISIFTTKGKNLTLVSYIGSRLLASLGYEVVEPVGDPLLDPVD